MVTFFEKLEKERKSQPGKMELLVSTHPNSSERVQNVSKQLRTLPKRSNQIVSTPGFKNMKTRLAKLPPPPKRKKNPNAQ